MKRRVRHLSHPLLFARPFNIYICKLYEKQGLLRWIEDGKASYLFKIGHENQNRNGSIFCTS